MIETLNQFGIVPVSSAVLKSVLKNYKSPNAKIRALEKAGLLIRLKKGLYVVSSKITGLQLAPGLMANHIYGPSYVSMESALRHYGLIPEHVYAVRSMTVKHNREFRTELGLFTYREVPADYFAVGITQSKTDFTYLIATPEKALCDMIIYTAGLKLRSVKAMKEYLIEDLRFDTDELSKLDVSIIKACADIGKKKKEMELLIKLIGDGDF